ncbi:carbohydrate ABC transporter permease [Bacillus solitudinis]|uniref:carbohydrate ABC transporter permease n=1 Tax=Bacillus solitudinis TaxID=2014074 RepID=UPI000C23D060|nr:sugar ABC transporter permease [Bacillus solitudinis]
MKSKLQNKFMFLFVVPALIIYLVLWIFPIFKLIQYSFTNYDGFLKDYDYVGFQNYVQVFKDGIFVSSLSNTVIYTIVYVVFSILISLGLALMLNMKIRGLGIYRTVAYIPALFSPIVIGFIWGYVYMPDSGMIATIANWLGFNGANLNLLGSYDTALYSISVVEIWKSIGVSTIIFLAGLQTIPVELEEAGRMDGANSGQITRFIRIPMLATAMTINIAMNIINGLKAFDYPFIMTNGGPGRATSTLVYDIYKIGFTEQQFGKASALAIVSFIFIMVITVFFVVRMNKREVSA